MAEERNLASHNETADEEDKYSSVIRQPGKYVPPGARNVTGNQQTYAATISSSKTPSSSSNPHSKKRPESAVFTNTSNDISLSKKASTPSSISTSLHAPPPSVSTTGKPGPIGQIAPESRQDSQSAISATPPNTFALNQSSSPSPVSASSATPPDALLKETHRKADLLNKLPASAKVVKIRLLLYSYITYIIHILERENG